MMMEISIENLYFSYRGHGDADILVFHDVSLTLGGGNIVGVVGRNGSGKTTLFDLIRGRITPTSGTVSIKFDDQTRQRQDSRAMISLVTQRPDASLCPTMTIFENYALVRTAGKWSARWAFGRAERERCRSIVSLADMGLERNIDEQVRFLSGGQKQALAVIFALSMERSILLMDEPTAALDHISSAIVLNLAAQYGRAQKGVVAIISHKIEDIISLCDSLIVVGSGRSVHFAKKNVEWTASGIKQLILRMETWWMQMNTPTKEEVKGCEDIVDDIIGHLKAHKEYFLSDVDFSGRRIGNIIVKLKNADNDDFSSVKNIQGSSINSLCIFIHVPRRNITPNIRNDSHIKIVRRVMFGILAHELTHKKQEVALQTACADASTLKEEVDKIISRGKPSVDEWMDFYIGNPLEQTARAAQAAAEVLNLWGRDLSKNEFYSELLNTEIWTHTVGQIGDDASSNIKVRSWWAIWKAMAWDIYGTWRSL